MAGRPKEFQDLRNTSLSLEREIIEECKAKNINLSDVCRDALISVLGDRKLRKKYDKFAHIPKNVQDLALDIVKKHPENIDGCIRIIKRKTGIKVGQLDFLNWVEKRQSEK